MEVLGASDTFKVTGAPGNCFARRASFDSRGDQVPLEQRDGGADKVLVGCRRDRISHRDAIADDHLRLGQICDRRPGSAIRLRAHSNAQGQQQHPPAPFEQRLVTLHPAEKLRGPGGPIVGLKRNWFVHHTPTNLPQGGTLITSKHDPALRNNHQVIRFQHHVVFGSSFV